MFVASFARRAILAGGRLSIARPLVAFTSLRLSSMYGRPLAERREELPEDIVHVTRLILRTKELRVPEIET